MVFVSIIKRNIASKVNIIGCEASYNQGGFHCSESFDGLSGRDATNGWAVNPAGVPQNVIYELEAFTHLNHIRFKTAMQRHDHHLTSFSLRELFQFNFSKLKNSQKPLKFKILSIFFLSIT